MSKKYDAETIARMTPSEFRAIVRKQEWKQESAVLADPNDPYTSTYASEGYAQANLVAVPKEYAWDMLLLCNRNPHPCCVIDVTEPGDPHPKLMAPDADLRTDLPRYRVFENGEKVAEPHDVTDYWRDDMVGFLIGCSWGFVGALKAAGVCFRSLGDYTTSIPLVPAGRLHGYMLCSCRAFRNARDAVRAIQITSRHLLQHGAPVHVGDPKLIGVNNIGKPDALIPPWPTPTPEPHEIVMFWGCGVTPQNVAIESKVPYMITHYPGHMFVTDRLSEELAVF